MDNEESVPMNRASINGADSSDGTVNTVVHINPAQPENSFVEQSRTTSDGLNIQPLKRKLTLAFVFVFGILIFIQLLAVMINSVMDGEVALDVSKLFYNLSNQF